MWRDGRDRCAVCVVSGGCVSTYGVTPAAQQVVGQGVPRLQLDGFLQMFLGGEADGQNMFTVDS